jgi:hypothetical protein
VAFSVNEELVSFLKKYSKELSTATEDILIGDTWISPSEEEEKLILKGQGSASTNGLDNLKPIELYYLRKNLEKYRQIAVLNNEILGIAEYYINKPLCWVTFQDFRGRIYRIGAFNFQGGALIRSLIRFKGGWPACKAP